MTTPPKFNIPLKRDGWKTTFLFGRHLFRGHVKLWEGIQKGIQYWYIYVIIHVRIHHASNRQHYDSMYCLCFVLLIFHRRVYNKVDRKLTLSWAAAIFKKVVFRSPKNPWHVMGYQNHLFWSSEKCHWGASITTNHSAISELQVQHQTLILLPGETWGTVEKTSLLKDLFMLI